MNGYVAKSAFAKIYGCQPSYVTKLKDLKKIVLSEDGKLVNVEASLRLIESTGDPDKQGVRERWNAYREGRSMEDASKSSACSDEAPPASRRDTGGSAYHLARTETEQINAQLRKIELRKQLGEVAEVIPLVKAVFDTHMAARAAILQLPDRLTQLVSPETDPQKVHDLIRIECERVCDTIQRSILRLKEQGGIHTTEVEQ